MSKTSCKESFLGTRFIFKCMYFIRYDKLKIKPMLETVKYNGVLDFILKH